MSSLNRPPYQYKPLSPYKYKPLKKGHIRLIEIIPAEQNEIVSARLIHVPLNDPGNYEALSYTWGTETPDRLINIDDGSIYVSPNLESALKQLRRPGPEIWERYEHLARIFDRMLEDRESESILTKRIESLTDTEYEQLEVDMEFVTQVRKVVVEYMDIGKNTMNDAFEYVLHGEVTEGGRVAALMAENMKKAIEAMMRVFNYMPQIHLETRGQGRRMWVDAICINQADLEERSEQVKHMLAIYSRTIRLVIWMGIEADDSDLAIATMRAESRRAESMEKLEKSSEEFVQLLQTTPRVLSAIVSFFSRTWFQRAWIVQEFISGIRSDKRRAYDNTIMVCGSVQMLADPAMTFGHTKLAVCIWVAEKEGLPVEEARRNGVRCAFLLDRHRTQEEIRKSQIVPREANTLLYWLSTIRGSSATDPRDKIYSALGLAGQDGRSGYDPSLLIIDYAVDVPSIFSSLVESVVSASKDLTVLSACGAKSELTNSTWVPDWTVNDTSYVLQALTELIETRFIKGIVGGSRTAVKGRPCDVSFDHTHHSMTARGIVLDVVEDVVEIQDMPSPSMSTDREMLWQAIILRLSIGEIVYKGLIGIKIAFWTTLLAGASLDEDGIKQIERELSKLRNKRRNRLRLLKLLLPERFKPSDDETISYFLGQWHTPWLLSQSATIEGSLDLFITKNKRYIGKSFESGYVKEGDIVCVLLGLKVPIILRKVDEHYEVVRVVYVHGLMEGEAIDMLEAGSVQLQDFELH
ncbi:hypothetical protein EG329_012329 [Mollisiaceae sp. DMI_Dod_QoI]|nr:hypothetical protein EG329_012329 [Helotiales sp. DMI_Dod_QoI]